MITANTLAVSTLQLSISPSARWTQILLTAFLALGLSVPPASAKCLSKDLKAPMITPVVAASLADAERPDSPSPNAAVSIVGFWNVTFLSGGEVVDVAFDAWHSDGTEILNDYTNPIEGNVCLGVWEQTGARTYKLKHPSWSFDSNGNLLGTVWIGETVTVSADGNRYSGSYKYDIDDTSGIFIEELNGQIKATRIRPD
jgi:hypothetical protein